jgi:hypothetical protein
LADAEIFRDLFNRVFELPLLRNVQKRNKKSVKIEGGKKTGGKNPNFV